MMRSLLYWLTGYLPTRYIDHEGQPYLERSYVCTLFHKRVYVHRFVASDQDGLHTHPFLRSLSLILAGWYYEEQWATRRIKRFFNYLGPNHIHRVVLPDNGRDVWTLFTHTARVREWGFFTLVCPGDPSRGLLYKSVSQPDDPAFSNWHLTAPTGRQLRARVPGIPAGLSYAGYLAAGGVPLERGKSRAQQALAVVGMM